MWKKLIAAVAGCGLATGSAVARNPPRADPDLPLVGPLAPAASTAEPPQYARGERPKRAATSEADPFSAAIFATPLPPSPRQTLIPVGGPLAAPILLPGVNQQGQPVQNALPPGDPMASDPTDAFVWGPAPASRQAPDRAWIWGSAELLLGNTSGVNVPPIVTTGPAAAGLLAGAVGAPTTTALFGGRKMLDNWRTGLRTELGAWFGPDHVWGASARLYSLFSTSDQFNGEGNGANVVNVPQVVTLGGVTTQLPVFVGFPGITVGTVATTAQTTFTGGDLNLRRVLVSNTDFRFELFGGYRQMHLGDELGAAFRASGGLGAVILLAGDDSIRTRNNFYGGQIGGLGSIALGRWTVQGQSAFAVGVNASDLDFSRTRLATIGTAVIPIVQTTSGGRDNIFSVAAEGGVRLGFRITEHAKLTVGYTGIYWSNVRRAQEQFNLSNVATGGTTHFYTNLMSLGGEVRY